MSKVGLAFLGLGEHLLINSMARTMAAANGGSIHLVQYLVVVQEGGSQQEAE